MDGGLLRRPEFVACHKTGHAGAMVASIASTARIRTGPGITKATLEATDRVDTGVDDIDVDALSAGVEIVIGVVSGTLCLLGGYVNPQPAFGDVALAERPCKSDGVANSVDSEGMAAAGRAHTEAIHAKVSAEVVLR